MPRERLTEIVGKKYSYLLVTGRSDKDRIKYVCLCDCGNIKETTKQRLENVRSKSCGCMKSRLCSEANVKHGGFKDGKNTPEYQSYISMMHRCLNPERAGFEKYGARGITVEQLEWLLPSPNGFLSFLQDMGKRPEGTSLDRIDGTKGYFKENCRWASRRLQAVNTEVKKTEKNTSKYRGVSLRTRTDTYMARIGNGLGGYEYLGDFKSEDAAAFAYNKRAFELHGDEAHFNVIISDVSYLCMPESKD